MAHSPNNLVARVCLGQAEPHKGQFNGPSKRRILESWLLACSFFATPT